MLCAVMAASVSAQPDPARDLVNPFIGTGGHGHTFPGACVPNGLVQLSPDTRPDGYNDWDGASGYHYSDSVIYGFSHTHLSGTGVSDLCDVLLMPVVGTPSTDPAQYRSAFRKTSEHAHAGYYTVHLDGPDVKVELTATQRVGVHRYTFPTDRDAHLVLDLRHRDHLLGARIERTAPDEIVGARRSSSWAADQQLFFVIRTSRPVELVSGEDSTRTALRIAPGREPVVVRVGISAVSIEGARKNLEAEVPHGDFDRVRAEAEAAWNAKLNKIAVEGGTREQQRIFYTALYHSYVAPYIFNDVDGHYRGMDSQVHHADHDVYTVFSLWDTFRSLHPLMTILEPEMTRDWIKTFLLHHQQGGRLPVWELWGNETDCMIGYHSVSVIADAYLKGIRDFDAELALAAMVHTAELDHFGLEAYKRRGYISSEDAPESVSRTLEYAYDDWCIARFAEALGHTDIAERFFTRSRNWQNLFDPTTGFFRARRNGGFVEPFDPYEVNFHYTEANAWHYAFFVPHDVDHFTALLGGPHALADRLDALFTASEQTTGRHQSDITGLIGQYAHGNEPSHTFAYLYNLSGRPASAAGYLERVMRTLYHDAPDGLSGNEDCGQMSAWYVLSALGFHPIAPGMPTYSTGVPLFDTVEVRLNNGRVLRITSQAEAGSRAHVVDVRWNDRAPARWRTMHHADLMEGGHLHFDLGPRAGSAPVRVPREASISGPIPAPVIQAAARTFTDSLPVTVRTIGPWDVLVSTEYADKPAPRMDRDRVTLYQTATVRAKATDGAGHFGPEVEAHFTRRDAARTMELLSTYAPQYSAGGDQALVDGLRGGNDFRTGEWQGYQGQDVTFIVDLGRPMRVQQLGLGALQDARSWIWLPAEVEFATSVNKRQWTGMTVTHTVPREQEGSLVHEFRTEPIDMRVRYVQVTARNAGPCPPGHFGAGGASWIFLDEFLVTPKP
jgi:predicted alpha-1,2-mannosidase